MIKKIISITLALIFIFTALPSCADEPAEDTAPESTLSVPETSEEIHEPLVLNSFSAREVGFNNDPYRDYLCFMPEKGSEEAERWGLIYAIGSVIKELVPRINEGEYVTITYSGEIEPLKDTEFGFITNIHSVTIKNDPREYGGINYKVAILRQNGYSGKLIISTHNDFRKLMEEDIMYPRPIADDASDYAKREISRHNNRIQLVSDYDEAFFNEYDLLMIFARTGSGGSRFDVTDISVESGICTVTIDFINQGVTCDVGQWITLISIPKEVSAGVREYQTKSNVTEIDAPF
jgi:hypothetical protein